MLFALPPGTAARGTKRIIPVNQLRQGIGAGLVRCPPLSSHNRRGDRVSRAEQATDALDRAAETMNDDAKERKPLCPNHHNNQPRLGHNNVDVLICFVLRCRFIVNDLILYMFCIS